MVQRRNLLPVEERSGVLVTAVRDVWKGVERI